MAFRNPSLDETRLLEFLGHATGGALPRGWTDGLLVEDMSDGGMGSLRLRPFGTAENEYVFHTTLAACQFKDADGVDVIATLYSNKSGVPFELDMWKVDFSPLVSIPQDLRILEEGDIPRKSRSQPR